MSPGVLQQTNGRYQYDLADAASPSLNKWNKWRWLAELESQLKVITKSFYVKIRKSLIEYQTTFFPFSKFVKTYVKQGKYNKNICNLTYDEISSIENLKAYEYVSMIFNAYQSIVGFFQLE